MSEYRYILEKYIGPDSRYKCPSCNGNEKTASRIRTFSRYIDSETGEYLADHVGRCARENNCGYHYTPKQYFQDNGDKTGGFRHQYAHPRARAYCSVNPPQMPVSLIPVEVFKASLKSYEGNNFVKFLIDLFGAEITGGLVSRYFIGSSKHWPGSTVFWQIDIQGKIRAGKIMLYSPSTGKRVKEPHNCITWVHSVLKLPSFELKQCLYGEHLIKTDPGKTIALVESEKTAIIASVYLPRFIWLATGSLNTLNADKCQVLKGRTVILYPDLKGFDKWKAKAEEIERLIAGIRFVISDLLETKASPEDKAKGLDLADYLIRFDYRKFTKSENSIKPNIQELSKVMVSDLIKHDISEKEMLINAKVDEIFYFSKPEPQKPENWDQEIEPEEDKPEFRLQYARAKDRELWDITDLESYFKTATLPTDPVKLDKCTTILNVQKMVDSHFETVKAQNGNPRYLPYLLRLELLKQILLTLKVN